MAPIRREPQLIPAKEAQPPSPPEVFQSGWPPPPDWTGPLVSIPVLPAEVPRITTQPRSVKKPNSGLIASGATVLGATWNTTAAVAFNDLGAQGWPSVIPLVGPIVQSVLYTVSPPSTEPIKGVYPVHLPASVMNGLLAMSALLQGGGLAMVIAGAKIRNEQPSAQKALSLIPGTVITPNGAMLTFSGQY